VNLSDDAKYAELAQRSRLIRDRLVAIRVRQRELEAQPAAEAGDDGSRLEAALAGRRTEPPTVELQGLVADAEILERARNEVREQLAAARKRVSRAIARELGPEHRAAVAGIAAAIGQLFEALEREHAVRRTLETRGADYDALPASPLDLIVKGGLERQAQAARAYSAEGRSDVAAA
jgi:hypothetical protein